MTEKRSVITVGNFDGVHLGHAALIDEARRLARSEGAEVVVVSFARHPLTELAPDKAPRTLMDIPQRQAALLEAGTDRIEWLQPDRQTVLSLSPRQFVAKMVEQHRPVAWVEGPNFRFGRRRAGDLDLLKQLGFEHDYRTHIVEPIHVTLRDQTRVPISSSLVRWLVANGRMADAELCLGRPYTMRGSVIQGEQRGRQIGFPTANLEVGDRQLPADGVYGGTATIDNQNYPVAISVGTKPTFQGAQRTFEAYILDFDGDLYDRTLEVAVVRWLRDQAAFNSVDTLVEQMKRDVSQVRALYDAHQLSAAALALSASRS